MGANIILMTNQRSEGNNYNYYGSSTTETYITGVAYASQLPDYNKFVSFINGHKQFVTIIDNNISTNDAEYTADPGGNEFTIDNISTADGLTLIKGKLSGEKDVDTFQLTAFDNKSFNVYYKKKNTYHSVMIQVPR